MSSRNVKLPLYQVDAFSASPFAGNPAAVVLLDEKSALDDRTRQQIAAEMNLSETSFVELLPSGSGNLSFKNTSSFKLRWNTPEREVPLCGHATLAAAAAIAFGEESSAAELSFQTVHSGVLTVRRADSSSGFAFEMSLPLESVTAQLPAFADPSGPLLQALMGPSQALVKSVVICERLSYLLVELQEGTTRRQLEALQPNFSACLEAAAKSEMVLAMVTAQNPPDSEHDFVSRCFAPWTGINEDPVTGSAHGILAPFWALKLGKHSLKARQCSERGGELLAVVDAAANRVKLLGNAAIVSKGELYV